jgi:hypothetical protein
MKDKFSEKIDPDENFWIKFLSETAPAYHLELDEDIYDDIYED